MNADKYVNGRNGIAVAALVAAIGFGFTSAQTPTMAAPAGMSEIAKLAAKGGLDAIDAMLDARSPGFRAPGALTQTKARRVASLKDAFTPKERVLGGERTRDPAVPPAPVYDDGLVVGPSPTVLPDAPAVVGGEALPPAVWMNPGAGGGTPPIIFGGGGGGGAGGGGGGGGGGETPGGGTPGVGNAVPEPATWASLLIGFFAIGFGLRGGAMRRSAPRPYGRAFS